MSDPADAGEPGDPADPADPAGSVGSAAEEAAKLLGAVSEWARDRQHEWGDVGTVVSGLVGQATAAAHDVEAHLATGEDCRYCPVCRAVRVYRSASPEVRGHLATAATSLLHAVTAALGTAVPDDRPTGVERIDLTGSWPEDGPEDVDRE